MIISALVYTGMHGRNHSVETIVCFDTCIDCGGLRSKCIGSMVDTNTGKMHIHHVYCNCDPYITHDELNQEWMIIRDLNDMGIEFLVDLNP